MTAADFQRDLRIATSRSMCPEFSRPRSVRLGWGDFDMFEQWMACGRRVTPDMLPPLEDGQQDWPADDPNDSIFVVPSGMRVVVPRTVGADMAPGLRTRNNLNTITMRQLLPLPAPANARNVMDP
jgi:hypothetical protein